MVKTFTKEELKKFDGKSGAPIYAAYKIRFMISHKALYGNLASMEALTKLEWT